MKVVILGGSGQVGGELKRIFPDGLYPDRSSIDLSQEESIDRYFSQNKPDLIINCAAYTQVDKAESEPDLAKAINGLAPGQIGQYASKVIHFSTDYVFNGKGFRPYTESDPIDPVNMYGKTKALGEKALLDSNPNAVVIRTSWVYSDLGKNFVKTILNLSRQKEELKIVADQIGSPTFAADLAKLVYQHGILQKFPSGIYHYANEGIASWYDLGQEIIYQKKVSCKIQAINSDQYPTPAKRPHYSVLDKSKIKRTLNLVIPHWKDSLIQCLEKIP